MLALGFAGASPARPVVVASKPFGESYLLAEMFAQLLEARGLQVDRRPGLGATEIAFRALRTNAIDVYPEYTGTGLLAILGEPPRRERRRRVSTRVARIPVALRRALASAAGIPEHLCDRGATRDRGFAAPRDARAISRARARTSARRIHAGLHRPRRRAARPAARVRSPPARRARARSGGEVPGARRGAGRRHRRLFDRRTHRALSPRRARRRSAFLPAVRGGGAGESAARRGRSARDRRAQ